MLLQIALMDYSMFFIRYNRPFDKPVPKKVCLCLGLSWIFAIFLAILPLLPASSIQDYFVESIWWATYSLFSTLVYTVTFKFSLPGSTKINIYQQFSASTLKTSLKNSLYSKTKRLTTFTNMGKFNM